MSKQPAATAAGNVILRLEGVSKVYSGTIAVKQADFEIHAGAVNVLVGENGAGKSTLMKIIAGVEQPTAGRLILDGRPVVFQSIPDAMRQRLAETAKALAGEARILIRAEPSSALSAAEVEILFRIIADLKRAGVAII